MPHHGVVQVERFDDRRCREHGPPGPEVSAAQEVELGQRPRRQPPREVIREDGLHEPRLVDGEARSEALVGAHAHHVGDVRRAVHVDIARLRGRPVRRRTGQVHRTGVDDAHVGQTLVGQRLVVFVAGLDGGAAPHRRVEHRPGAGGPDRAQCGGVPRGGLLRGEVGRRVVDVDDGGAGVKAGDGVGRDLLRCDGHVRGALPGRDAVDGHFDDGGTGHSGPPSVGWAGLSRRPAAEDRPRRPGRRSWRASFPCSPGSSWGRGRA